MVHGAVQTDSLWDRCINLKIYHAIATWEKTARQRARERERERERKKEGDARLSTLECHELVILSVTIPYHKSRTSLAPPSVWELSYYEGHHCNNQLEGWFDVVYLRVCVHRHRHFPVQFRCSSNVVLPFGSNCLLTPPLGRDKTRAR